MAPVERFDDRETNPLRQAVGQSLAVYTSNINNETIADEYLKDGLEIFKFGMSVEDLNHILPSPSDTLNWESLQRVSMNLGSGSDVRSLGMKLSEFGRMRYFLIFIKEAIIFARNPCFSENTGQIYFIFMDRKLFWIHLVASDALDCPSHEPLFRAVANFYQVELLRWEFGGLGVILTQDKEQVKVLQVSETGPASQAGIKPGDEILAANGQPFKEPILADATSKLRGPVGSEIAVTLKRANAYEP
jgi:PDZ domain